LRKGVEFALLKEIGKKSSTHNFCVIYYLSAVALLLDTKSNQELVLSFINPLALELDIYSLAHNLCKM